MKKSIIAVITAVAMLSGILSACAGSSAGTNAPAAGNSAAATAAAESTAAATTAAETTAAATTAAAETTAAAAETATAAAPAGGTVNLNHTDALSGETGDKLDPYTFSLYYNYDWWGIKEWGADAISKSWSQLYNITIEQSKPDSDAAGKLNLMISSGDLPDVIQMDRGADNMRMAQLGLFQDLAPLEAKNPNFDNTLKESTRNLLKIDGKLYSIPHWARSIPTGGNDCWIYDKKIYEACGSPDLTTFEGLYNYAKAVKANVATNEAGASVIPFSTGNNADAFTKILFGFWRSFGGPNWADLYTAHINGHIQSVLRDPLFRTVALEANKWYREGLIVDSQFTDTNDQLVEKFSDGRVGLLYYDMSQDSVNHFRQILMQNHPGDTYDVMRNPVYPPANGVDPKKIYADAKETPGWNVLCITTKAKNPQRIFDFLSYMLTKQGSIEMMYGPQGDWWDSLNENGSPILKTAEAETPTTEKDRIGSWTWSFCSFSDWVDLVKFDVNKMQPPEKQDWVITMQSDVLTPIMFVTDEYVGFNTLIDPQSDLGINKQAIWDQITAEAPKMIMAASADECNKILDDLIAFADAHGMKDIESTYDASHQEILKVQGGSMYDR